MNVRYSNLKALLFTAAVIFSTAAAGGANASVTYDYTGNDFTFASGPYSTSARVTGSMNLSVALGNNLSDATVTPTAFDFSMACNTSQISRPTFQSSNSRPMVPGTLPCGSFQYSTDSAIPLVQQSIYERHPSRPIIRLYIPVFQPRSTPDRGAKLAILELGQDP